MFYIDSLPQDGFTPLAVSLQQGHDKVVALLLENDASGSKMRLPALHMAAKKNDVKAAKLLLQQNKNSDDKDEGKKCLVNDAVKVIMLLSKVLISKQMMFDK